MTCTHKNLVLHKHSMVVSFMVSRGCRVCHLLKGKMNSFVSSMFEEIVVAAPHSQLVHLIPVVILIIVVDETHHCGVIHKLQEAAVHGISSDTTHQ